MVVQSCFDQRLFPAAIPFGRKVIGKVAETVFCFLVSVIVIPGTNDIRYFVATKIYGCDGFFAVATKRQEETA